MLSAASFGVSQFDEFFHRVTRDKHVPNRIVLETSGACFELLFQIAKDEFVCLVKAAVGGQK